MLDISPNLAGLLGFALLVAFLTTGVPIGISMAVVGFLGVVALRGAAAFTTIYTIPYSAAASWALSVIPMFLLMGYMAFHAGFTKDAFEAAYRWVGRLPGGLAVASLIGAAIFGACSGSSVAATAALGKIALPEMERHGYSPRLAAGAVAIGATLDALIPPSILRSSTASLPRRVSASSCWPGCCRESCPRLSSLWWSWCGPGSVLRRHRGDSHSP